MRPTSPQRPMDETTASYTRMLTFDLEVEILCRLPVKTLMQLRCVCKSWNSLILDPKFAKKHLCWSRKLLNRHHLLLLNRDFDFGDEILLHDIPLPFVFNSLSTSIRGRRLNYPLNIQDSYGMLIGSCDGILCFFFEKYYNSVMVWNPSIKKFKILPPLEYQHQYDKMIYGFGYDCLTNTYKVVAIRFYELNGINMVCKTHVKLHTLGKDTWKTIEGVPSGLRGGLRFSDSGIFVSGTINWLVSSPRWVILSLDLGNESYQEFLPPDYGGDNILTFGILRDCLCIVSQTDTLVNVWLMRDYENKDSWTKLFVVPYSELFFCQAPSFANALYILEADQILLDFGVRLAVYNSKDGTRKFLEVLSISGGSCDSHHNHVYIESLISP